MALGVSKTGKAHSRVPRGVRRWALLALVAGCASCVPPGSVQGPSGLGMAAAPTPATEAEMAADPAAAALLNRTRAILAALERAGDASAFRGLTPVDQLRSLDCLAQAIHYEAASESEDGQRAVAQVVLNRVRHPAWPNSVCGVVYQGPLRPGGGCQFTFTCDGSLARRAGGIAWARARMLAAEALAGRVFAPVGSSTHYHTHAVSPAWAPLLQRTLSIGAHAFYRLPGSAGEPAAFTAAYAGSEPLPRPSAILVRPSAHLPAFAALPEALRPDAAGARAMPVPSDIPADPRWQAADLPESTVREAYRQSGQWRQDAPEAITGH